MRLKWKFCSKALVFWLTILSCFGLTPTYPTIDEGRDSFEIEFPNDLSSNDVSSHETISLNYPRSKRTITYFRQMFPGLSQLVEAKIRRIIGLAFRIIGQSLLGGGGDRGGNGRSSTPKITLKLPTYADFEENEITDAPPSSATVKDAYLNFSERIESDAKSVNLSVIATTVSSSINNTDDSTIDDRESITVSNKDEEFESATERNFSINANESDSNSIDDSNSNVRRKRDSGFGSGHFLVDLIQLMAGSGVTPEKDEELNAPKDNSNDDSFNSTESTNSLPNLDKDDIPENHYNAEIPGPLTRLFVITNRALSKLMHDLIMRLAQTSERIVNFKAKLITAII